MFAARPAHTLTKELIADPSVPAGGAAAFNKDKTPPVADSDKPMTDERRKELLSLTAVGREVLANSKINEIARRPTTDADDRSLSWYGGHRLPICHHAEHLCAQNRLDPLYDFEQAITRRLTSCQTAPS